MDRSSRILSAAVVFVGSVIAAQAGPCTTQISQVEAQIQRDQAAAQPGGPGAPSAPQSVAAQLHHQPTTESVESALSQANADGVAALDRAKKADAIGNARECTNALAEAKQLYGLQ
jgi:hypothetical protein